MAINNTLVNNIIDEIISALAGGDGFIDFKNNTGTSLCRAPLGNATKSGNSVAFGTEVRGLVTASGVVSRYSIDGVIDAAPITSAGLGRMSFVETAWDVGQVVVLNDFRINVEEAL